MVVRHKDTDIFSYIELLLLFYRHKVRSVDLLTRHNLALLCSYDMRDGCKF